MKNDTITISKIVKNVSQKYNEGYYTVCWVKDEIKGLEIDGVLYPNMSNSIFFLDKKVNWKLYIKDDNSNSGYILNMADEVLSHPLLSKLHISQIRMFNTGTVPLLKLSPGIEKRTQAILEMIDELLGSHLNNKEDALISLLNTFFVYCDGQCNIKTIVDKNHTKANIVYAFKQMVDQHLAKSHEVSFYASLLNISTRYLNECVQEVLNVSSKNIIIEQLLIRSRHALKFTNKTIKEIGYELGFSNPDYFSYFFKTQTGVSPSELRKSVTS
ncbi:helix-turn-helix domain-containing protein [Maribacter sp. MAR_2009_72]|uniref:helix-turn-helix domain-containing protein n=1 Tax=Maribacter sp. MAR_2009_72 TaxID=1250050 RepID=UPI00119BD761|nr:AraC family transcriptional regulator [Maribacter sp. MAR_2009_72]TVZ16997.1 AraC-like DNA-binding protein [Maribacter sp. MAR_2009_72]